MRKCLSILPILALFALISCTGSSGRYVQISGYAQGGEYTVKLNLKGVPFSVEAVRDSIDALLLQVDTTLSGYNKKSLLSRFNAGEKVPADPLFLEMYRLAYRFWEDSDGALDFGAGPLYDAWGFGFRNSDFPTEEEIADLLSRCGMRHLPPELPVQDGWVNPADLGFPRLNYNAVAQGYTCDLIARFLYRIGVRDMLVDIGEIWCDGLSPSGRPWTVGVDRPVDRIPGTEQARVQWECAWDSAGEPSGIVTSGNYRKFYVRDGKKYAHTIDPVSGRPVTHNLLSATVVSARSAAEADAVATWCMVVGLEASQALLCGDGALEGYLIYSGEDGGMQEWVSPGFRLQR